MIHESVKKSWEKKEVVRFLWGKKFCCFSFNGVFNSAPILIWSKKKEKVESSFPKANSVDF